jgi:hypothetical protein
MAVADVLGVNSVNLSIQIQRMGNAECRMMNAEWNAFDSAFRILHSAFP